MNFLLDTNTCVYAIKRWPGILDRLKGLSPDEVSISAITLAELLFGAAKSSKPLRTRGSVAAFLLPFEVLAFERAAAEAYAEIRLSLEQIGRPIGERDLLIASIAQSRRLTVVTHNVREFGRVPGLLVEDWV
jgi:tRNA(fMet)-specific endonuclease VapC